MLGLQQHIDARTKEKPITARKLVRRLDIMCPEPRFAAISCIALRQFSTGFARYEGMTWNPRPSLRPREPEPYRGHPYLRLR